MRVARPATPCPTLNTSGGCLQRAATSLRNAFGNQRSPSSALKQQIVRSPDSSACGKYPLAGFNSSQDWEVFAAFRRGVSDRGRPKKASGCATSPPSRLPVPTCTAVSPAASRTSLGGERFVCVREGGPAYPIDLDVSSLGYGRQAVARGRSSCGCAWLRCWWRAKGSSGSA